MAIKLYSIYRIGVLKIAFPITIPFRETGMGLPKKTIEFLEVSTSTLAFFKLKE
jgi:hypothetical protein